VSQFLRQWNFPSPVSSLLTLAWLAVVRIREILDPELREKIVAALAERRGCSAAAIPDWFELDDADFVDLLEDLKTSEPDLKDDYDPRM
jgi:hypothetical protein